MMGSILEDLGGGDRAQQILQERTGLQVYARSLCEKDGRLYALARSPEGAPSPGRPFTGRHLLIVTEDDTVAPFSPSGEPLVGEGALRIHPVALTHASAEALREALPFTAPEVVGLRKSAGLGDRLGIATPGHVRAIRAAGDVFPIYAQQSIREMERTERTPDEVMNAATWGVFQEGWRGGYGADADHLKTLADVDLCVAAGYTMYTFDPREHVDNEADSDPVDVLRGKYERLPWDRLGTDAEATYERYAGKRWSLTSDYELAMSEEDLLRAACKYGTGLAHIAGLYRHLVEAMDGRPYEVEVSVDETETPTRPAEHFYIASELQRLGVEWVSLAPRYVGRFEKGVDYIGDLDVFRRSFRRHVAIARALGPYKLSLHSGSDKFSIYPIVAEEAGEMVHLKTAGTSYLEALRAIAQVSPDLFREIMAFAIDHYSEDRATYHVSGELDRVPDPDELADEALMGVLNRFDARQVLHVTFGTVLTARDDEGAYLFRDRIYATLEAHEEEHYRALAAHIGRHLDPFVV